MSTGPHVPAPADPTVLTTQLMRHELDGVDREMVLREEIREREHGTLQELLEARIEGATVLAAEKSASQQKIDAIRETHRLELKADSEKALSTAMIAAEKAVQAALAAAEKARDQQTIASQLATTKAEQAASEQMKQQGETFSTAISGLNTSVNDMKSLMGELRAEKRGAVEQVVERRASTGQWIALAAVGAGLFGGLIVALVEMLLGG